MERGKIKFNENTVEVEVEIRDNTIYIHFPEGEDASNWYHAVNIDYKANIGHKATEQARGKIHVWKRVYNPFTLGGDIYGRVTTELLDSDYEEYDAGKGFTIISIMVNEKTYVFDKNSGGLVGYSVEEVMKMIADCDDIEYMKQQSAEAKAQGKIATAVSFNDFFKY
jgi:hypothetical protein